MTTFENKTNSIIDSGRESPPFDIHYEEKLSPISWSIQVLIITFFVAIVVLLVVIWVSADKNRYVDVSISYES